MERKGLWEIVVVLFCAVSVVRGLDEGDSCTLDSGQNGICTPIRNCPSALDGLKDKIFPKNCFIDGFAPVVCCLQTLSSPSAGGKRLSEKACEDYGNKLVREKFDGILLPTVTKVNKSDCDFTSTTLIVGGEKAKEREFPHMAALGYKRKDGLMSWDCGGSLVSSRFVLTAAHCITSKSWGKVAKVRMGDLDLARESSSSSYGDYAVVRTFTHPDYKPPAHYNDLAILELEKDVELSEYIRPACLYTKQDIPRRGAVASGWGTIGYGEDTSNHLLKVQLDIIPNEECKTFYKRETGTIKLRQGILDSMLCSGVIKGAKDTCQGDSGGPLQIVLDNRRCLYHIIGVVSFGKFCGFANSPGVYVRVSSYLDWIESVVWSKDNR